MTSDSRLLDYYERELIYLRTAGQSFAKKHPQVANRLELSPDKNPDPHVERLLEAFAFLTARIQETIDDSVSDLARNMLERLYPHALRPIPSASVVCFEPEPGKVDLNSGYHITRGTRLFSQTLAGETVRFHTCHDVTVWPLRVSNVELITDNLDGFTTQKRAQSVLKISLNSPGNFALKTADLKKLRFYIRGSSDVSSQLCDLLAGDTISVNWGRGDGVNFAMPGVLPQFIGNRPESAMLPERDDTHPAYRLMLEYFAFPAKFQFFDLDCSLLGKDDSPPDPTPAKVASATSEYALFFVLKGRPSRQLAIQAEDIQLGCTPIINLFSKDSEPLRVTGTQSQYRLIPDIHRERSTEIYAINHMATLEANARPVEIPEFYSSHGGLAHAEQTKFWYAQRCNSLKADVPGSDMQITFVDTEFNPTRFPTCTMVAKLQCTNRKLAEQLMAREPVYMEDADKVMSATLLHKPTNQCQPSLDGSTRWKLVSQLSLNHLAISAESGALERLKELLSLNNLSNNMMANSQIKGVKSLQCKRVTRYIDRDPWQGYRHGYQLRMQLDQELFRGSSTLLFATVLHRFLTLFAGINTFVELIVERGEGLDDFHLNALTTENLTL